VGTDNSTVVIYHETRRMELTMPIDASFVTGPESNTVCL